MELVDINESEATVLELRDVTLVAGPNGERAPAWAAHLAKAEVYDWWKPGAKRVLPWAAVWEIAKQDVDWQKTFDEFYLRVADKDNDAFLRSLVDAWLARSIGLRCYPAEERGVLRRLRKDR